MTFPCVYIDSLSGVRDVSNIKSDMHLSDLGLDSLMTTEILQVLGRTYNVQLTLPELQGLTIEALREM